MVSKKLRDENRELIEISRLKGMKVYKDINFGLMLGKNCGKIRAVKVV